MDYRDRTGVLIAIGVLILLVGLGAAFLGPAEMATFYFFAEGGRFHYEGFGFGSFMFGNIATQIIGYYVIAGLLIPLGYGHIRRRRWARKLALALIWSWLVVGIPLAIVFLLVLLASKDLTPAAALIAAVLVGLSYALLPWLLIRFYRGRNVRLTFEARDSYTTWIETLPLPVLVLGCLCTLYAIMLHVPIFFNGLFPLFGTWLSGMPGIVALDVAIWSLVGLIWGLLRRSRWAWWGALLYFGLLTASALATLLTSGYAGMLAMMAFPALEMEMLQGIPLQGYHFAAFIALPLLITLGVILGSRRYFGKE